MVSSILVFLALVAALCAPASAGYRDDIVADVAQLESKLVELAEAVPEDKFGWRPAEGVRSVSESLMHVAAANFFFPTLRGMSPPEGVNPQTLEQQITEKTEVVETLKQSFAHAREAIEGVTEEQLSESVNMFGREVSIAGYLHAIASHGHEHLGQMIAYARSIGVTPPWSAGGGDQ
jgi:uncharacterized damage-inducible protein DinB